MSAEFWDKRAAGYDADVSKHDDAFERTVTRARSVLGPTDVVLDLGCATGEYALAIAPRVKRVYGIDVSSKMIELASRKARDQNVRKARFHRCDVFDPRVDKFGVTAVLALNILHLVDDPEAVVARLVSVLRPGGLLLSETPCLAERGWLLRALINGTWRLGLSPRIRSLDSTGVEALITGGGLEIVTAEQWDAAQRIHWVTARKPR